MHYILKLRENPIANDNNPSPSPGPQMPIDLSKYERATGNQGRSCYELAKSQPKDECNKKQSNRSYMIPGV